MYEVPGEVLSFSAGRKLLASGYGVREISDPGKMIVQAIQREHLRVFQDMPQE